MSAPLYLVKSSLEVIRAWNLYIEDEIDVTEMVEALNGLLAALARAEPIRIVSYLTDDEADRYLKSPGSEED